MAAICIAGNLSVTLRHSADRDMKLDFRALVRTAITVESSPKQIGWLIALNLNRDLKNPVGFSGWNLGMLAGPIFNNREYNAYFYAVKASEATNTRRAYDAAAAIPAAS